MTGRALLDWSGSSECCTGLVTAQTSPVSSFSRAKDFLTSLGLLSTSYNWTAIEAGIGLVCACFPVIAPLFKAKPFQERSSVIKEELESSQSGSNESCGWFRSRNSGRNTRISQDSESTLHEKLPIYSNALDYVSDQKVSLGVVPSPPPARIRDSYQERRELLRPGLGDPRVVNEVYRGVAPENMGLDRDGKPLPMTGIKVRTNIEFVRSPIVRSRLEDDRFEMSHSDHSIWGLDSAR